MLISKIQDQCIYAVMSNSLTKKQKQKKKLANIQKDWSVKSSNDDSRQHEEISNEEIDNDWAAKQKKNTNTTQIYTIVEMYRVDWTASFA